MVIFLAGAHGVGKTFLGRLATKTLQFRFAVASSLIRDEMDSKQSWGKTKRTRNIDSNQEALISAVTKIQKDGDTTLVLDGHFVLRNESGDLTPLPSGIFKRLGVGSVILLEAPVHVVRDRLEERGAPQSLESISELEKAELDNARHVCEEIGIPLTRLRSPSKEELLLTLKKVSGMRE